MEKIPVQYDSDPLVVCISCGKVQNGTGQWHLACNETREDQQLDFKESICSTCSKSRFPKFYVDKQ